MELVLYYRGPLRSNGDPRHKHHIREHFHAQLRMLWEQPPLSRVRSEALDPSPSDPGQNYEDENLAMLARMNQFPSLLVTVGGIQFVPLVATRLKAIAELDITLMRPEPAGRIVTSGGDIDNRIKTLLDALKIPDENQVKVGIKSPPTEQPIHCLLEDDQLITRLAISAEQLLEPVADKSEVVALIRVKTRRTLETLHNHVIA